MSAADFFSRAFSTPTCTIIRCPHAALCFPLARHSVTRGQTLGKRTEKRYQQIIRVERPRELISVLILFLSLTVLSLSASAFFISMRIVVV